jgi:hypothetical protein
VCSSWIDSENVQALITSRTGGDHRDAWATKDNLILQNYRSHNCESIKAGDEVSLGNKAQKNLTVKGLAWRIV